MGTTVTLWYTISDALLTSKWVGGAAQEGSSTYIYAVQQYIRATVQLYNSTWIAISSYDASSTTRWVGDAAQKGSSTCNNSSTSEQQQNSQAVVQFHIMCLRHPDRWVVLYGRVLPPVITYHDTTTTRPKVRAQLLTQNALMTF